MNVYHAIGIMSGTSMDGLDIVYCKLFLKNNWQYEILKCRTISYTKKWKERLINAHLLKSRDFVLLDHEFGKFIGKKINEFILENNINKTEIDLISSHGHTIFHETQNSFSCQIGNGNQICAVTNLKTVTDFRSLNVAFNGQGAPLVPIGDHLLFNNYDACLNLGGVANISLNYKNPIIAGDINFANMSSNYLAEKMGFPFDKNGHLAKKGELNNDLILKLNELSFFNQPFPKSLSIEDFKKWYLPVLAKSNCSLYDQLFTTGFHLAESIKKITGRKRKLLVTGGGVHNQFWIQKLKEFNVQVVIPESTLIEYKEALIFSLLGVLKVRDEVNCLSSVTGATRDLKSGIIFTP